MASMVVEGSRTLSLSAVGDTLIVGVNVLGSVEEYGIVSIVFGFCWWVLCLAY